jgi:hypothetical protein
VNVEPEVLAVAATAVGGVVGALVKVYSDLATARKRIDDIQTERLAAAKAEKADAVADSRVLMDAVAKVHALAEGVASSKVLADAVQQASALAEQLTRRTRP